MLGQLKRGCQTADSSAAWFVSNTEYRLVQRIGLVLPDYYDLDSHFGCGSKISCYE